MKGISTVKAEDMFFCRHLAEVNGTVATLEDMQLFAVETRVPSGVFPAPLGVHGNQMRVTHCTVRDFGNAGVVTSIPNVPAGHVSPSVYAGFDVVADGAAPCLAPHLPARVAVWTTTPWTLPANLAVAVNGGALCPPLWHSTEPRAHRSAIRLTIGVLPREM